VITNETRPARPSLPVVGYYLGLGGRGSFFGRGNDDRHTTEGRL
jgi:hypothetical protein